MIRQFKSNVALLLVDIQKGVDDLKHWGGPTGRRNNPEAEKLLLKLLEAWRAAKQPVVFTTHDSREANSPLKLSRPGGALKPGFAPREDELVITKNVNSAFVGTPLEIELRRRHINRLVIGGFFTNICVSTTVRMSNNLGFDTYLAHDGCMCTNRIDVDGVDWDPEVVHAVTVASLHGEFCTALKHGDVIGLLNQDSVTLNRSQGNE